MTLTKIYVLIMSTKVKRAWKVFFTLLFLGASGCAVAQSLPDAIHAEISKCDSQTVFLTLIKSDYCKLIFSDLKKYYNEENHEFDSGKRDIINCINNSYNLLSEYGKDSVISIVKLWCYANREISKYGDLNPEFPAEAILYSNRKTRFLLKKYINGTKRTWISLSSSESYDLNINFLKHVESLAEVERTRLFSDLKMTAINLSE